MVAFLVVFFDPSATNWSLSVCSAFGSGTAAHQNVRLPIQVHPLPTPRLNSSTALYFFFENWTGGWPGRFTRVVPLFWVFPPPIACDGGRTGPPPSIAATHRMSTPFPLTCIGTKGIGCSSFSEGNPLSLNNGLWRKPVPFQQAIGEENPPFLFFF
eukprot:GGOE01047307.1.p2 GENE.GGOE01047307.1~~GGOE01047307.1.p2  ORF type:complete len:156 (-),score=15.32 GGOE01047307.1:422-889(-)